jgi:diguanylate cyclase (GGDEF)-like protein
MRSLSLRVTAGILYVCGFLVVAVLAVGTAGIIGVHSASDTARSISADELQTARVTAVLAERIDSSYATGLRLAHADTSATRDALASTLTDRQIPAVESVLANVRQIHAGDAPSELADIVRLDAQWGSARSGLSREILTDTATPAADTRLSTAFAPVRSHLATLIAREASDARASEKRAADHATAITAVIVIVGAVALIGAVALGWAARRRIRKAVEPAEDQVEFADTMQLASNEDEANELLQRHLERSVTGSAVTVLNRNNSADRLEAATTVPADSPLVETLAHADPRACLAVRSGRSHDATDGRSALLGCAVCGDCPGNTTCTPLTVSGEVIGSVLVNRSDQFGVIDRQRIRESVAQAAPVLANLRNLAIAELRAATDSLTGLPNKRAVADTFKRMLAQASRTLSPLSLLLLDLDHFKDLNDRYGHPVGDQVLANVGAALQAAMRDSDFAGRNGGEEFAILLPDTDVEGALLAAEKIRESIGDITITGTEVHVTASIGIASYPFHGTTTEKLERLADSALYVAKRSGRNRSELAALPITLGDQAETPATV